MEWLSAIIAAVLWTLSAPIVNTGLERLPDKKRIPAVMAGLLVSLSTGAMTLLLLLVGPDWIATAEFMQAITNPYIVIGGMLSFPIATGLYYFSGHAFGSRLQVAAQFVKVKPFISMLLAFLLLGERISAQSIVGAAFIMAGIAAMLIKVERSPIWVRGVALGLATATAWAAGDLFMAAGLAKTPSLASSAAALVAGWLVGLIVIGPYVIFRRPSVRWHYLWPFAAHGVVSFAAGYFFFFNALAELGVMKTVLITAFWPVSALLLVEKINKHRGRDIRIAPATWVAAALLLIGLLIHLSVPVIK